MSKSIRISDNAYRKVQVLKDECGYESLTNVIQAAVGRLYQAEMPKEREMQIATHKSGNGTVVMKEGDTGYIVTVHKEALPPHYSKEHKAFADAATDFERLTRKESTMGRFTHQYWQHKQSGETYAVRLFDGEPIAFTGPLYYTEYEQKIRDPAAHAYDDEWDDDPEDYKLAG